MDRVAIVGNPDMNNLGNAVHAFMCCDCDGLSAGDQEAIAYELLEAHASAHLFERQISYRFSANSWSYIRNRWPGAKILREWPLSFKIGSLELHGAADLVLETPAGYVIIDHKTFPGGEGALIEKAKSFAGQLMAYRTALEKATKIPVLALGYIFRYRGIWSMSG